MSDQGVLLVNLGSPASPEVRDVRRYLREFLMDERVLDAPWPIRFGVVHLAILPFRPRQSAEAYRQVWTKDGSPLIAISRKVQTALQKTVPVPVELAMRYQQPSIPDVVRRLAQRGVRRCLLIPLFPHYAMSSYETAVERVKKAVRQLGLDLEIAVQPPFFAEPAYIRALVASAEPYLAQPYDHLLFSFHGLPERHLRKSDPSRAHCLTTPDCCQAAHPAHATCYRHQCFATVRAFVEQAPVPADRYSVAFQSRLGRDPWLTPYTDHEIARFAREGVRRLLVICPAFVSDCLETIEEIGIRGAETFHEAGGETLTRIPCLNEHPAWVDALTKMVRDFLKPAARIA